MGCCLPKQYIRLYKSQDRGRQGSVNGRQSSYVPPRPLSVALSPSFDEGEAAAMLLRAAHYVKQLPAGGGSSQLDWKGQPLQRIGWRVAKRRFVVALRPDGEVRRSVPAVLVALPVGGKSSGSSSLRLGNAATLKAVRSLLAAMAECCPAHLVAVEHIGFERAKERGSDNAVFCIQRSFDKGSVRDKLYRTSASWKDPAAKKYASSSAAGGKPFKIGLVQELGRAVLEAAVALESKGWPVVHLHAGNVLLRPKTSSSSAASAVPVSLADYENALFGLTMSPQLAAVVVPHVASGRSATTVMLGALLFEMATGRELEGPVPPRGALPPAASEDPSFMDLLEAIFGTEHPDSAIQLVVGEGEGGGAEGKGGDGGSGGGSGGASRLRVADLLQHPFFSSDGGSPSPPKLRLDSQMKGVVRAVGRDADQALQVLVDAHLRKVRERLAEEERVRQQIDQDELDEIRAAATAGNATRYLLTTVLDLLPLSLVVLRWLLL
eukprot:g2171.t1